MDYANPSDVVASMFDASLKKLTLAPRDLIRGAISGAVALRNLRAADCCCERGRNAATAEQVR